MNMALYEESQARSERASKIRSKLKSISKIQRNSMSANNIRISDVHTDYFTDLSGLSDVGLKTTIETLIETALVKEVEILEAELKALMSDYQEIGGK